MRDWIDLDADPAALTAERGGHERDIRGQRRRVAMQIGVIGTGNVVLCAAPYDIWPDLVGTGFKRVRRRGVTWSAGWVGRTSAFR